MEQQINVGYQAIQVDSRDEAESLANYLNEHGIAAFAQEGHEVNVPLVLGDMENYEKVTVLTKTWRYYWDSSGQELLGLAFYVKED